MSMWESLARERARFIGGTLQDMDPDVCVLPETSIEDVVLDDGGHFVVVGKDYSCSVNTDYGMIGGEYGWLLVVAPDVRWRFKAKE